MTNSSELEAILGHSGLLTPYLAFISAPSSLQALVGVSEVFLALAALPGFEGFPAGVDDYLPVAREIVEKRTDIAGRLPNLVAGRELPARKVLHGVISKHPIYSLLYFRCEAHAEVFLRLQQAMLAARHSPFHSGPALKNSDFQSFGLAVRQISEVPLGRSWLASLDQSEFCSLPSVRDRLWEFPSWVAREYQQDPLELSHRERRLIKQVKNSHLLLDAVTGEKVKRKNNVASRSNSKRVSLGTRGRSDINPRDFMELRVLGDKDDPQEFPEVWALCRRPDDKETEKELECLGVESDEATDRIEFIFLNCQLTSSQAEAVQAKFAARGAAKKIELQNQFLPMSTQCLTDEDLISLGQITRRLGANERTVQLSLVLRVMLATSSSVTRAQKLRIIQSDKDKPIAGELAYDINASDWVVPVNDLEFATPILEFCMGASRATNYQHLRLPDIFHFGRRLVHSLGSEIPEYPFLRFKCLEKRLKNAIEHEGQRLTLARIERALLLRIASKVEPTQATFMLDKYLSPSSARRYYTAIPVSVYREAYVRLCAEIAGIASRKEIAHVAGKYDEKVFIGARYCPETGHIRDVIASMNAEIRSIRARLRRGKHTWIKFHNLYTIYAIYTQGFLTAIRSVVEPFVGKSRMSQALGIAIFTDKGCEDEFHTRTVPLHRVAVDIAENYESHRRLVITRLKESGVIADRRLSEHDVPSVFFIDPITGWCEARPSVATRYLSEFTPLPLNSNRKYLRTRLLEMGVTPHAVDTLMGHASRGEAFWEHSSTSCFDDLKAEILAGLDEIVSELGLYATRGITR